MLANQNKRPSGDAFLKYLASVYCFVALDKNAHEGIFVHFPLMLTSLTIP